MVGGGTFVRKVWVKPGDLFGGESRAGVRALVVAGKRGNARGAKGGQEGGSVREGNSEKIPAAVPEAANPAGEVRAPWPWTEPSVWTERWWAARNGSKREMAIPSLPGRGCSPSYSLGLGQPILSEVNYRPESRMREIRTSGSEGGGAGNPTGSSYPYHTGSFPATLIQFCLAGDLGRPAIAG